MNEKDYMSFFSDPDFKKVLERYEMMLANGNKEYFEAEDLADIAEYYANQNKEQKAEEIIKFALTMHPDNTDLLILKARTMMLKGDYEAASQIAKSIEDAEDKEVYFLKAELMINDNQPEKASKLLQTLTRFDTDEKELYHTYHDIANVFMDYNLYIHAIEWLEMAEKTALSKLNSIPKFIHTKEQIITCYKESKLFDEAIEIINKTLDQDPYLHRFWFELGNIYNQQEKYNKAIDAFEFALAIDDTNYEYVFAKANSLVCLSNKDAALELYLECINAGYEVHMAHYTSGMIYNFKKEYNQAIIHLEKALELVGEYSPFSCNLYLNLALAYTETKRLKEALDIIEKACQLEPDDQEMNELKENIVNKINDSLNNS